MRPAEQVWSDPDVASLSTHSRFFLCFGPFHFLLHASLALPSPCKLHRIELRYCSLIFLLNCFILSSVYLLFAWARGLRRGGSEVCSLPLCRFSLPKRILDSTHLVPVVGIQSSIFGFVY